MQQAGGNHAAIAALAMNAVGTSIVELRQAGFEAVERIPISFRDVARFPFALAAHIQYAAGRVRRVALSVRATVIWGNCC